MKMAKDWLIGLETELFLIDRRGRISNNADKLIKESIKRGAEAKKECAHNMIEILACPHCNVRPGMSELASNLLKVSDSAKRVGVGLYPFGTYPGAFKPNMRTEKTYGIKKKIFGKRFAIAGRCIGFHCHYDTPSLLPFAKDIKILEMIDIHDQQSIKSGYNFLIASEPALACLMQSSPFYQGINIGKDSRVIVYRGGKSLNFPLGLYADYEDFGQLQGYKHSVGDIIGTIEDRFSEWLKLIKSVGFNIGTLAKYGSVLSTAWNPIKINPHNTLEQRGMDMNYISHVTAATASIKAALARIYSEGLEAVPSEIGDKQPFKVEGKTLHIPSEDKVRFKFQYMAAHKGLYDKDTAAYCKSFMRFVNDSADISERRLLRPFTSSLTEGKTVSDRILAHASRAGWQKGTHLEKREAAELALHFSRLYQKDLEKTEVYLSKA
jgi:hypothetical protein